MELLAPVGDLKSFYVAVYNGADAVYLGLQNFNARMKADNFTVDNIAEVVEFAHIYHVKVYVTINILIKDSEVDEFLATVRACVRAKVDAFIIQDLGMAQLLKAQFPNIVLHASTQMGIHNLSGAKVLEQFGFKRVVLARETKLEDIKLIKAHTKLEIEYFAQGALCVAFSGNCYLSSIKNGNSGNRGKCLQLCRLPYQVYDGERMLGAGYYLSAKDLCLMKRLPELAEAGVDCLKIEGRLKRASYVAQVTRSYRQALDNFKALDIGKEKACISELFSRGEFNEDAYLEHNFKIINPQVCNHQGKLIGVVLETVKFKTIYKITLRIKATLGQNDALRFVQGDRQFSVGVGNVNVLKNGLVEIFSKQKIPAGCDVYLLKSESKEKVLIDYVRLLPVDFYLTAQVGKPARLVACCGVVSTSVEGKQVLEKARTAGVTYDQVYKQVSKLNGTKFSLRYLECELENVFMPVAELNELRRQVIVDLERVIIAQYDATLPKVVERQQSSMPTLDLPRRNFYMVAKGADLDGVAWQGYDVILCPAEYSPAVVRGLVAELTAKGVAPEAIYLNLPIVNTQDELQILDEILAQTNLGIVANNYAHLQWVKSYKTIAGLGLNVYNDYTAAALMKLGCEHIIWSLEKQQAANCGSVLVSGYPALMTLCHCPVRTIYDNDCAGCRYHTSLIYEDEKHNRYGIRRIKIKHCYFELFSEEKYEKVTNAGKIYDLREGLWKNTK